MRTLADPTRAGADCDLAEAAAGRLYEALSILDAIDRAELFAELPAGPQSAVRHQCGVSMLAVLRRDLEMLARELESASLVQGLIDRLPRVGSID